MRKLTLITALLFLARILTPQSATAQTAQSQGKIATSWHCPADSASHKFDVGDAPEHTYAISQGTCAASSKSGDLPEKTAAFTEFDETWKDSYKFRGRFNVTLENGDKVFYSYEGNAADPSKPPIESWKITGGTGKYKSIKGSGGCQGKNNSDGTSDWSCTGTYSLPK